MDDIATKKKPAGLLGIRPFVVVVGILTIFLCATLLVPQVDAQRVCVQPKVIGRCRAAFRRFYFDTSRRTCLSFTYGGCGGNDNNFETKEACRSRCFLMLRRDICQLPPRTGPCRARLSKYYYNSSSGRCQSFYYGGCLGNRNRFHSLEECNQRCN